MKFKTIIVGAFAYVFEYRVALMQRLIPPILIYMISAVLLQDAPNVAITALFGILAMLMFCVIAITTHRIILLGPGSVPKWGIYVPTKREAFFLLYTIVTSILMFPAVILAFIPYVGAVGAVLLVIYLLARWSLIFPAIATDQNWSLSTSWKATNAHTFTMMIVVGFFPMIIGIPESLLAEVPALEILSDILSIITLVLTIAALSVAFQTIQQAEQNWNKIGVR